MERVKRFELSTSSLARKRSSQLSYTRLTVYRQGGKDLLPLTANVNALALGTYRSSNNDHCWHSSFNLGRIRGITV